MIAELGTQFVFVPYVSPSSHGSYRNFMGFEILFFCVGLTWAGTGYYNLRWTRLCGKGIHICSWRRNGIHL